MENTQPQWYILRSYIKNVKTIKDLIEKRLRLEQMEGLVKEIFIPSEEVAFKVKGKETKNTVTYFPGYILIKMCLTDKLWHLLNSLPNISSFVGHGDNNTPSIVSEKEIELIRKQIDEGVKQAQFDSTYKIGQSVSIVEGPFKEFNGVIEHINHEKSKLTILVNIFGRSTPLELAFDKVKPNE